MQRYRYSHDNVQRVSLIIDRNTDRRICLREGSAGEAWSFGAGEQRHASACSEPSGE
jgi:hypothetical protein